jgi:hypothetical protein
MSEQKRQYIRDMGPITDGEYISFQNDVNYAINVLGHVNLDIYLDASGTIFAQDASGNPLQNVLIESMTYTYQSLDASGNTIDGLFEIQFYNNKYWSNRDAINTLYWYYVNGIYPKVIYQFT